MAMAKRAVDSTIKRIAMHTAEIIASIVLLIIVCLPLIFVVFVPTSLLGVVFAPAITIAISMVSGILGYAYMAKLSPSRGGTEEATEELEEEVVEEVTEVESPPEDVSDSGEIEDATEADDGSPES